jgi:hypothetical protein
MGMIAGLKGVCRAVSMAFLFVVLVSPPLWAQSPPPPPAITARAVELVDASSGQVLFAKKSTRETADGFGDKADDTVFGRAGHLTSPNWTSRHGASR